MSPADKQILITGGKGFIGSHLAERLTCDGADITIFDIDQNRSGANDANVRSFIDDITVINGDVRDEKAVRDAVAGKDVVFHLAAQVSRVASNERPQLDGQINALGTLNVLEAAADEPSTDRVVFTSSRAVYGSPSWIPVPETANIDPLDVYGIHKATAERYCSLYNGDDLSTVVARLANVYGPRAQVHDTNYGVLNVFVRRAIEGDELTVFEPGTMQRDCVYVDDTVDALIELAGQSGVEGEIFNVGTGRGHSILEIAKTIVDIAGTGEVSLVEWPSNWEEMKVGDFIADVEKIHAETGWETTTDLRSGLERSVEFYKANLDAYI